MRCFRGLTGLVCLFALPAAAEEPTPIRLDQAKELNSSATITRDIYNVVDSEDRGALVIKGDGIVVDFGGAALVGSSGEQTPDMFTGRGIVIRGRDVTLRNANVRGYKVGIYAEDAPGLKLINCDVSRNFRQRLKSTVEREDLDDWLYGHDNDGGEWLRYGSGIYLLRSPGATVERCRARNGQNGLCVVSSDKVRVVDCDMSFMSGWGLAMWRSSGGEIFNNRFDWCIRGYSHGVYSRGQDSAGILVYEQCHRNIFAYNSATHSGDGLFLWAGNETLNKTGKGGCNGNIVYRNDFSHAAANGIEATFSTQNIFLENKLLECDHGIWAGYSYDSHFESNDISKCSYGVSIEHGSRNRIIGDVITDSRVGVHLWSDEYKELAASEFCKQHDGCPSRDNLVFGNRLQGLDTGIQLVDDQGATLASNQTFDTKTPIRVRGEYGRLRLQATDEQRAASKFDGVGSIDPLPADDPVLSTSPFDIISMDPRVETRRGFQDAMLPEGARRGRHFIFVDEWGPYDFTDERLFPGFVSGGEEVFINILGDRGTFAVRRTYGDVSVEPLTGQLPGRIVVKPMSPSVRPFAVEVEANGHMLASSGNLFTAPWTVRFYAWSEADDPRGGDDAWRRMVAQVPADTIETKSLDFRWAFRSPTPKLPADRFAAVATATVALNGGRYRVKTVSDDGVRVMLDGQKVIENWTWHAPTADESTIELSDGDHELRVEYFEIDGFAQLQLRLEAAP